MNTNSQERSRRCLCCRRMFPSSSAANRICKKCKKAQKGSATYIPELPLELLPRMARDMVIRATNHEPAE
jgi:hypothetical protein